MKRKKDKRKKCLFYLSLISISLFTIGLFAFKAGEEFQVNTYTTWYQRHPAIAMDEKGNFVITWLSHEPERDGSGHERGFYAQRFNSKGEAIGEEFQVNTYACGGGSPAIAMDKRGNFVITWMSYDQDGSKNGVFAQRFNSKGKGIGREFQVNTYTDSHQQYPAIAMDRKGNFVITWMSNNQDDSEKGVFAQMYNRKGKATGKEFQVNTYPYGNQQYPAIAMDEKGNFVITWDSHGQDSSGLGVFAQMYSRKGEAIGIEFQVNTYTHGRQSDPSIAMDTKGNFVITWDSHGQDGSMDGVFAQMYNSKGEAIGEEFQVNTYTNDKQCSPAVGMDNKRNFVITWNSKGQDGSMDGIFAQRFNRKGQPIGTEFQVNTYTKGKQAVPAIAMKEKGNFIITWQSSGQDGSLLGIFAKMFQK